MKRMEWFTARMLVAEEARDLNSFIVFLYENADGTGEHIEFQRSLVFDEQDAEHGMDTYCIATGEGASHYGGLVWWSVCDKTLILQIDPRAAAVLGVDQDLHISLEIERTTVLQLIECMKRVLGMPPKSVRM